MVMEELQREAPNWHCMCIPISIMILFLLHYLGHGGPRQYLQYLFPNQPKRNEFALYLDDQIKESTRRLVESWRELPVVQAGSEDEQSAVYVHPCKFSFASDCSRCGAVELHKAQALIEQYLVEGFLTSTEPLLVRVGATWLDSTVYFLDSLISSLLSVSLSLSLVLFVVSLFALDPKSDILFPRQAMLTTSRPFPLATSKDKAEW